MQPLTRRKMICALAAAQAGCSTRKPETAERAALHYLSLTEIAERIRSREVSPVEVTEAQLARIESLDPRLHAFQLVLADRARAQAKQAEAEIQSGRYRGPLHGVPIALKDLIYTKGIATQGGLKALAGFLPEYDATVAARLESAGAILLGKLNLTEGAMAGYHRDFQVPRNPWDPNRTPGFSSSGSGVAAAAGLSYGTLGSDTGGSIRFPSAANGIVGLKPTYGRVSRYGVLALAPSLDHIGPMTRRVADAAAMLTVIAGEDPSDPTSLREPVEDYSKDLEKGIRGVRIGFDEGYGTRDVPPHMAAALRQALGDLAMLGASVVNANLPAMDEISNAWFTIVQAEALKAHERTYPSRASDYGAYFRTLLDGAAKLPASAYGQAMEYRRNFNARLRTRFEAFDILLCPTTIAEAPVYDPNQAYEPNGPQTAGGVPLGWLQGELTFPYDFNGYPTLSLPCGQSPEGMPLSLQLVGKPLGEAQLLQAGYAYESATEWHLKHPPV